MREKMYCGKKKAVEKLVTLSISHVTLRYGVMKYTTQRIAAKEYCEVVSRE